MDSMAYLEHIEYKDTTPFIPNVKCGKVVKVYDGDTITIAAKLENCIDSPIYRFSVRLNGIDTPEIKGGSPHQKELAMSARDALNAKVMGKIVVLKNTSLEKYGRVLADVFLEDENMSEWMISNKYAVAYDGGNKCIPEDWK
jgi:endonuclease YncB( thermonuclease family)